MSEYQYDVAMVLRVYPKPSSAKPAVYAEDKLKLVEFCFKSFVESAAGVRVKLWLILNSCPPEYEAMFRKYWPAEHLVVLYYSGVPPGTTLHEQSRILIEQKDAPIVYFSEDDYFFLPGQFKLAVDFLRQHDDVDFISLYEHPDLHNTDLHRIRRETRQFSGKNWITALSTTHSFMAWHEILSRNAWLFLTFNNYTNPDLGMWMALTKLRVFNAFKLLQWLPRNKFWSGSILYAWYYFWRQILFGRRYKLWVASPAIATHMVATMEAPGVDWRKEFRQRMPAENSPT
jgi:hypothetical protein